MSENRKCSGSWWCSWLSAPKYWSLCPCRSPLALVFMLGSHCTTFPCMLIDYLIFKVCSMRTYMWRLQYSHDMFVWLQDRTLLDQTHLTTSTLNLIVLAYAIFYLGWLHFNYAVNGGNYPYPFLWNFDFWGWVVFFMGIVVFLVALIFAQLGLYWCTTFLHY